MDELDHLKKVRRPQISKAIDEARQMGDLKENAEYHAAREDLAHVQRRIANLETKLGQVQILEEQNIPADKAYIGATIMLEDTGGQSFSYTLVDPEEADFAHGRISIHSHTTFPPSTNLVIASNASKN